MERKVDQNYLKYSKCFISLRKSCKNSNSHDHFRRHPSQRKVKRIRVTSHKKSCCVAQMLCVADDAIDANGRVSNTQYANMERNDETKSAFHLNIRTLGKQCVYHHRPLLVSLLFSFLILLVFYFSICISGLFSAFLITVYVITFGRGGLSDDRLCDPPAFTNTHRTVLESGRYLMRTGNELSRTLLQKITHFSSDRRFVFFFNTIFFCFSHVLLSQLCISCAKLTAREREKDIAKMFQPFFFCFISISFSDHLWDLWAWARPFYVRKRAHIVHFYKFYIVVFFLLFSSSSLRPFSMIRAFEADKTHFSTAWATGGLCFMIEHENGREK